MRFSVVVRTEVDPRDLVGWSNLIMLYIMYIYRYKSGQFVEENVFFNVFINSGSTISAGLLWIGSSCSKAVYQRFIHTPRPPTLNRLSTVLTKRVNILKCSVRDCEQFYWFELDIFFKKNFSYFVRPVFHMVKSQPLITYALLSLLFSLSVWWTRKVDSKWKFFIKSIHYFCWKLSTSQLFSQVPYLQGGILT